MATVATKVGSMPFFVGCPGVQQRIVSNRANHAVERAGCLVRSTNLYHRQAEKSRCVAQTDGVFASASPVESIGM